MLKLKRHSVHDSDSLIRCFKFCADLSFNFNYDFRGKTQSSGIKKLRFHKSFIYKVLNSMVNCDVHNKYKEKLDKNSSSPTWNRNKTHLVFQKEMRTVISVIVTFSR